MGLFFHTITEENKLSLNKPLDTDVVYYSELNEWSTHNAFRSFCLKYVVDHCIYYKVGRKEHAVDRGSFLLACKQPGVQAYFDSRNKVKSICIDICPSTVAEAFTVLTAQNDHDFDNYLAGYFQVPEFFESVCPVHSSAFGHTLNELVLAIGRGEADRVIDQEWFLDLVEKIIFHEYGNYLALQGIQSVRLETRKEILARLQIAKRYVDEAYLQIKDVGEIAAYCNMSPFHFFRSFKQAFAVSPYQYLLGRRLDHARQLIAGGGMSMTEIAWHCNFPDVFTFSKAFKRQFKIAPSRFSPPGV